ncbi:MAG: RagB/SusD family nutrient uptake outer membrane protein, partial [Bacteroidales bacterium]|nr:RagB/SusD family nutrient uptake outer membrane protein [Bacteroidales bacterium]
MKKIVYSVLAFAALLTGVSCEKYLDIPQKGVTAIENFYQTDEDAIAALNAAYARFATRITGQD